jgi:hypothetical protein
MSNIRLKMLPISSGDFEFNAQGRLEDPGDVLIDIANIDNVDAHLKEFRSVMGIGQAIKRILKTSQATGLSEGRAAILNEKALKLANLADTEIYRTFKNTAESLLSAGFTKSQSLNKARQVAFKALKHALDTLSITDPELYPRAVLATQIKDPATINELSAFINQI